MYSKFKDYLSMTKPRLSSLVIFTAGIGIYLGGAEMSIGKVILTLSSITLLVGGACALNCWAERDIDKLMERTATRPLPSGRISSKAGLIYSLSLCTIALTFIFLYVNALTACIGITAMLSYIFLYTPAKRITPYAVFLGAIPGALPPLMGQTAVTNTIEPIGLILFGILFFWQLPHFLAISMMYSKDYGDAGIIVFPNTIGTRSTVLRIVMFSFFLVSVSYLPVYYGLVSNNWYSLVTIVMGLMFCGFAIMGLQKKQMQKSKVWAKAFFFSTLVYLPTQLGTLLVHLDATNTL